MQKGRDGHQVHCEGGWTTLGPSLEGSAKRIGSEVLNLPGLSHPAGPGIRTSGKGVPKPQQNTGPFVQGPTEVCS